MNKKKKILWVSEFCIGTGFSRVSEALIKYLCPYYDITVLDLYRAIQGRGIYTASYKPTPEEKINVIGKGNSTTWSADIVIEEMKDYDCIFIIQDIWNINKFLSEIKKSGKPYPKIIAYSPVDAIDHNPAWYENADMLHRLVTYTDFAKTEILRCIHSLFANVDNGVANKLLAVIPHGMDSDVFYNIQDRSTSGIREELYGTNQFNDCFIFLNANRNQPRKRLNLTLEAFKIFLKAVSEPDKVMLHMHCGNTDDNHINIMELSTRMGIVKNVIISNGKHGMPNWSESKLNLLYNATDAGLNTGIGEGWGLCNTEHAMLGKPQIVPHHSACKELFYDVGVTVRADVSVMQDNIMTTGKVVNTLQFAQEMLDLYYDKQHYLDVSIASKNKFFSDKYSWVEISKMWITIFDSV